MNILTKPLKLALSEVGAAIKSRPVLPILGCVRLRIKEGMLELATCNLDAWLTRLVPSEGDLSPICTPHQKLKQVVDQCGEKVSLEIDGNKLLVKSGNTVTRLPILPENEFPVEQFGEMKRITVMASDVAEGINSVAFAADNGSTSGEAYWNVFIKIESDMITCVASRRVVTARWQQKQLGICDPYEITVPAELAEMLVPILKDEHSGLYIGENYLSAKSVNGSATVKLFAKPYLRWEGIQELFSLTSGKAGITIASSLLKKVCTYAAIFASENELEKDAPPMQLEQSNGTLALTGGAENQFSDSASSVGKPCIARFNSKYLNEALPKFTNEQVNFTATPSGAFFTSGGLCVAIGILPKRLQ